MSDLIYDKLLDALDEGKLPVACPAGPDRVYYRTYLVEDWSVVMTGSGTEREEAIVRVVRFTAKEAANGSDS